MDRLFLVVGGGWLIHESSFWEPLVVGQLVDARTSLLELIINSVTNDQMDIKNVKETQRLNLIKGL